ncbi:MAG TPA: hypothetical protein PK079_11585 [Leptospiraceae bacterium]|nr:hypothetical protein [Leptospiraceae bacterium]HMW05367.1 hypothetical protein [Leptospiraceae bacterium]HMX34354.1 hypothetical protein [Leptospiraceae bacterium]HMY31562.1 hypothetical protein [Leptospiraceae bacterium]HMZ64469.1 hypothetical protein [Leptospiraceae bacterium]
MLKTLFFLLILTHSIYTEETIQVEGFTQEAILSEEEISFAGEKTVFIKVTANGYLSSGTEDSYLEVIGKKISEKKQRVFLLLPSGYEPKIWVKESESIFPKHEIKLIRRYLHDLCFDRRQLIGSEADYSYYSKLTEECYVDKTRDYLKGNRFQYAVYRYFGRIPEWTDPFDFILGFFLYILLFLSSLPHLLLFLFIYSFFKEYFRKEEYKKKLMTVLFPFIYGFLWVFGSIYIGETFRFNFWGMGVWKFYFYISGLFFGLGFLGIKSVVNRVFHPEEDVLPDWAIGLILFFSPLLIFAAGAGGGKQRSSSSNQNTNSSNSQSTSGGGGTFGGGGASGGYS